MQEPLSLRLLNMTEALKKKAGFRKRLFFFHNYFHFYLLSLTFLYPPPPTLSPLQEVKAEGGC